MIKEFVDIYNNKKEELQSFVLGTHPGDYKDLITRVITFLSNNSEVEWRSIDPTRITEIDNGDYQGTLLYLIADSSYQPDIYWYVFVSYGSCSGCDTLQGISNYDDGKPNEEQTKKYMTLILHIIQKLKVLEND